MSANTYRNIEERDADKAQQLLLLGALNAWSRALRLDECGAWRINGKHGHVYTWGDGKTWVIYAAPGQEQPFVGGSGLAWTWAKKRLNFCEVAVDGDDEGTLRLKELPTREQADTIRAILGIRKRVEYSPEALEAKRVLADRARASIDGGATAAAPLSETGSGGR